MSRALRTRSTYSLVIAALLIAASALPARAQQSVEEILKAEAYLSPPDDIARVVLAPRHENISLSNRSPDGKYFLISLSDGLPPIANYAKPFYRLGGVQIDPGANRNRRYTTSGSIGFELIEWETGNTIRIDPPRDARVGSPQWSPDGSKLAYFAHFDDATRIYVYDIAAGRDRSITRSSPTLTTLSSSFAWTQDGEGIMTVLVPADRGPEPVKPAVPQQPMVRVAEEGENKLRVFASLLESPYEMNLLEYCVTGQLVRIDVASRRATNVGEPGMYRSFNVAPDGQYLRVTTMEKPFSYIVPVSSFGSVQELWNIEGEVMAELDSSELRTGISGGGGAGGGQARGGGDADKRSLSWRPDGVGMSFLQQEPRARRAEGEEEPVEEEEQEEEEPRKDRVMQWLAPYDSTSMNIIYESETRMSSVSYSADSQVLFIMEPTSGGQAAGGGGGGFRGGGGGAGHLYAVYLDNPDSTYTIYNVRSRDIYKDPGRLMTKRGPNGPSVVRMSSDGNRVYLSGTKYYENWEEEAPRPFIHSVEIKTGERDTLWTGSPDHSDRVLQVMDDDLNFIMISRESRTEIADSYLLNVQTGEMRKMTNNVDHSPEITNCVRERFQVTRADGIKLWVNLTLPPGYVKGTELLPAMFWFYPREYSSQEQLDESKQRTNINSFPRVSTRSMVILTKLGYAIVEPDCPIMGAQGALNDSYTADLRQNLYAVVRALDDMEVVDPDRMAIGGHSYGAFGTANALIQTPFFRAGIAGDGNYNRLLTPAGFQSERRELWEAREVYLRMSPLLWANEMNGALLMYHGQDDQNAGTAPFHAPKMFHTLNVLGKTTALYMYPYEAHGPATKETNLDLWARWIAWLDRYVMNYKDYEKKEDEGEGRGRRGGGGL